MEAVITEAEAIMVVRASKVAVNTVRAEASTRAAVETSEAVVTTVPVRTVTREVEIAMYPASLKRSTKKRSRIKYAKHKPSFLVIRARKVVKRRAGTKNARIWQNVKVLQERITSCRLLSLSA